MRFEIQEYFGFFGAVICVIFSLSMKHKIVIKKPMILEIFNIHITKKRWITFLLYFDYYTFDENTHKVIILTILSV